MIYEEHTQTHKVFQSTSLNFLKIDFCDQNCK